MGEGGGITKRLQDKDEIIDDSRDRREREREKWKILIKKKIFHTICSMSEMVMETERGKATKESFHIATHCIELYCFRYRNEKSFESKIGREILWKFFFSQRNNLGCDRIVCLEYYTFDLGKKIRFKFVTKKNEIIIE